jgi:hypothetical protein
MVSEYSECTGLLRNDVGVPLSKSLLKRPTWRIRLYTTLILHHYSEPRRVFSDMDSDTNSLLDRLNALLLSLPESQRLDYLAQAQIQLFEQSGSIEHLESAIQMYENAAAALPEEDPKRNEITVSLAIALQRRYTALGDIHDLDRAI